MFRLPPVIHHCGTRKSPFIDSQFTTSLLFPGISPPSRAFVNFVSQAPQAKGVRGEELRLRICQVLGAPAMEKKVLKSWNPFPSP